MLFFKNILVFFFYKFGSYLNKYIKGSKKNITNKSYFNLISKFKKNGFVVIENYLDAEDCDYINDKIVQFCENNLENIWSHSEQKEQRIFGAQNIEKKIENFFLDKKIEDFASEIYNTKFNNMMVMANKINYSPSNLGSGSGWHRDSVNYQFKAILYLSDVSHKNVHFNL